MTSLTWWATFLKVAGSCPTTRKLTGQSTGGPNNRRLIRIRASAKVPLATCWSNAAIIRSRSTGPVAVTIILANEESGCSGLTEMKKRGAPPPT